MYTSSEIWINKLSIDVWFVMIGQYLENLESEVEKNSKYSENRQNWKQFSQMYATKWVLYYD